MHMPGWGNIEESIEIWNFEGITRGHAALKNKHQGCNQIEAILEKEKEVKETESELKKAIESLSQQRVFSGRCPKCPQL